MTNLFSSITALIGRRTEEAAPQSAATAAAQTTPIEALPAHDGVLSEPPGLGADEVGHAVPRALPLIAYAAPHEALSPPKTRRSRAISLLRSTSTTTVASRTLPTLTSMATRHAVQTIGPLLTETERVRLQVMQTQLQLSVLRLYDGPIDGIMSPLLATALRYFQTLKNIRATGTLTAGTLAALGVPLIV